MKRHDRKALFSTLALLGVLFIACRQPQPGDNSDVIQSTESAQPTQTAESAQPTQITESAQSTQMARVVTVKLIEGTVEVLSSLDTDATFGAASEGMILVQGDELRTGAEGRAVLEVDDGTIVILAEDSWFAVKQLEGTSETPVTRLFLNVGRVFSVSKGELPGGAAYEVETPVGVAAIRGSAMNVFYFPGSEMAEVGCLIGSCAAQNGSNVELMGGQWVGMGVGGFDGQAVPLDAGQLHEWDVVFDYVEDADVTLDDGIEPQCTCDGGDLHCDDGSVIVDFPSCTDEPRCGCRGTTLVCADGTEYADDARCMDEPLCGCEGTTFVCDDGTKSANDARCMDEPLCGCEGTTFVCDDGTKTANDPSCGGGEPVTCTCEGTTQVCSDGSKTAESPDCK